MELCRKCGIELDLDGTCAACMLAGAFGTDPTPSGSGKPETGGAGTPVEALEYDSFGPYRILSLLGEGGMGAVYLAEQTLPLRRQVALKVVKLGVSFHQILSRFDYERQTLALMDHPNIAHVHDAGVSEKGRPYFVMEYVDGLPITQYCDQHRLNTRERLELFIPVCLALQHAHQKGVIHRDIKPSNVMVTLLDGHAAPKVIDFGIARATEQLAAPEGYTQLGQFMGTPEYMSPEQADLVTGDIDTRSDVYSLGVLLYELLIGAVPFDAARLRQASLTELLRIIREEDAIPMTAKLTGMGQTATEIAGKRRTDPSTLRRLVRGDLNWVVKRAMEKDRQRRYAAASDLAADIRRHLDDLPVLAGPPGALYHARKFVRRYRRSVIAAAAVLAALIAGIFTTTWQAAIARRERAEAIAARTLAEARLEDVHALAEAMLFEINDDVKDLAGGTKAREALVRLGQQYLNKEAMLAQTSPRRRQELAEAFLKVGDLQGAPGESNLRDVTGARQSYGRSVAILDKETAAYPNQAKLRHLLTLAYVRQAQLEESASAARTFGSVVHTFAASWAQLDELEPSVRAMLERASISANIYTAQWPADPQGLRDRCDVMQAQGEFAQAVTLRERILTASPGDPVLRWELAHAQLELGSSLVLKNRREALQWLQQCADACERLNREDPAKVQYQRDRAVALGTMTRVLLNLSRLDEAVASARQSVSILEQLTASDRRNASFRLDLSAARVALSNALYDSGRAQEALENVALAAAVQEEQAARYPDNPDFPRQAAYNYRNAGRFKTYMRDFRGALEPYRKAEAIDRRLVAAYPGRFELREALRADLDSIAGAFLSLGNTSAALQAYRDAFAAVKPAGTGEPAPETLVSLALAHQGLANGLRAMSRWSEAIQEQRAAVDIWQRRVAGKPGHQGLQRALARSQEDLARLYEGSGDLQAAVAAAVKARPFLEADFTAHPQDESALTELRNALLCLRTAYLRIADYEKAIAAARQVVAMTQRTGVISRAAANRDLGSALLLSGRRDEALATFRRALPILDETTAPPGAGRSYPIEKEPSPYYRHELASSYLALVSEFTATRREEDAAAILTRILPVLDALVRDHPGNNLYRDTLLRAYRSAAAASLGLGEVARSLEFEQNGLKREPTPASPREVAERALRLARTGSLQLRLGSRDAANASWRQALAGFQQAARDSGRQWSAGWEDLSALETLRLAERGAAFALERLGDVRQAQLFRDSSHQRAAEGKGGELSADHADAVLGLWKLAGERGDYRPYFQNATPSNEQLQAVLAQGWRNQAEFLGVLGGPIPLALEAAGHALELSRRSVATRSSAENRLGLARSLQAQGDVFRAAARSTRGPEALSSYQHSHDAYVEALQILTALQQSGQLVTARRGNLIVSSNDLIDAGERLRIARDQRVSSSR
ncbi:serine/threonine-protein kinase [uncultured Paludibaculum sp.]|uniref:serine/threonine-protein kinase n=1 Tax=uncultured Paludibaculum sp. TaxID=1765020 RepID=UPI002AAAAF7D|nr:serine/threonine-protein kinase [uncultured Paludibaculum sp.]